jgi:PIN domain nuclease of toxin-antitoxin system
VTSRILLDTHIALWLDSGDERLRPSTRTLIEDHWQGGGAIAISAITAWEIALLVDTGRITLDVAPEIWLGRFLSRPGLEAVPLTIAMAMQAYRLSGLNHRDPADRLLIASAVALACPMVTYDTRILEFGEQFGATLGFVARKE